MARLESYNGNVEIINGFKPKNNGKFPLIEAYDIMVSEDGTRLDQALVELRNMIGATGIVIVDVDSTITPESENPAQTKAIYNFVNNNYLPLIGGTFVKNANVDGVSLAITSIKNNAAGTNTYSLSTLGEDGYKQELYDVSYDNHPIAMAKLTYDELNILSNNGTRQLSFNSSGFNINLERYSNAPVSTLNLNTSKFEVTNSSGLCDFKIDPGSIYYKGYAPRSQKFELTYQANGGLILRYPYIYDNNPLFKVDQSLFQYCTDDKSIFKFTSTDGIQLMDYSLLDDSSNNVYFNASRTSFRYDEFTEYSHNIYEFKYGDLYINNTPLKQIGISNLSGISNYGTNVLYRDGDSLYIGNSDGTTTQISGSSEVTTEFTPYIKIYDNEATKNSKYAMLNTDEFYIRDSFEDDEYGGYAIRIAAYSDFTGFSATHDEGGNAVPKTIVTAQSGLILVQNNDYHYCKMFLDGDPYLRMSNSSDSNTNDIEISGSGLFIRNSRGIYENGAAKYYGLEINTGITITKANQTLINLSNAGLKFGANEWAGLTVNNDPSKLLLYRANGSTVMLSESWLRITNATNKTSTWLGPTHFQIGGDGAGPGGSNTDINIDMSYQTGSGTDADPYVDDCTATVTMRNHGNTKITTMVITPTNTKVYGGSNYLEIDSVNGLLYNGEPIGGSSGDYLPLTGGTILSGEADTGSIVINPDADSSSFGLGDRYNPVIKLQYPSNAPNGNHGYSGKDTGRLVILPNSISSYITFNDSSTTTIYGRENSMQLGCCGMINTNRDYFWGLGIYSYGNDSTSSDNQADFEYELVSEGIRLRYGTKGCFNGSSSNREYSGLDVDNSISKLYYKDTTLSIDNTGVNITNGALLTNKTSTAPEDFADNEFITKKYLADNAPSGGSSGGGGGSDEVLNAITASCTTVLDDDSNKLAYIDGGWGAYKFVEAGAPGRSYWVLFSGTIPASGYGIQIYGEYGSRVVGSKDILNSSDYLGQTFVDKLFYVPSYCQFRYDKNATGVTIKTTLLNVIGEM